MVQRTRFVTRDQSLRKVQAQICSQPPRVQVYFRKTQGAVATSFVARLLRYGPDTPYKKCIVFDGGHDWRGGAQTDPLHHTLDSSKKLRFLHVAVHARSRHPLPGIASEWSHCTGKVPSDFSEALKPSDKSRPFAPLDRQNSKKARYARREISVFPPEKK